MNNDKKYLNFEDALREREKLNNNNLTLNHLVKSIAMLKMADDPEFSYYKDKGESYKKLEQYLKDKGFRKFKILNSKGLNSIVFDTTKNQIIKFTTNLSYRGVYSGYREACKSPYILQPISTEYIDDIKIEIFTKVESLQDFIDEGKITYSEAESKSRILKKQMKEDGFNVEKSDLVLENISLMKDGTPIVIDDGEIRFYEINDYEINTEWVSKLGKWKQDELYPNIKTGKVEGVYSKEDLPTKYPDNEEGEKTKEMIEKDGLYRSQLAEKLLDKYGQEKLGEYVEKYKNSKGQGEIER